MPEILLLALHTFNILSQHIVGPTNRSQPLHVHALQTVNGITDELINKSPK